MLKKFEIIGVHLDIDKSLRRYVRKKLGGVDRYMPRQWRDSAHLEVRLREEKIDGYKQAVCEAILRVPHETIGLVEKGVNLYAAVDIVKTKLKQQTQRYKEEFASGKQTRHLFHRLRHKLSSVIPGL